MKTAVLSDSGCALTVKQAKEKGLYMVPLQVIDGCDSFQDGVDITTLDLYERLRQNHTPKTSMPITAVIADTIEQIKNDGYDEIVAVPLSSGLSSTWQSMQMCADDAAIPMVVIETYTTCDLQGHIALYAKQLIAEGKQSQEVKTIVEDKIKQSGTIILPNDIQHLKRGGRLTPIAATAANLLKIKPILKIDPTTSGKIDVWEKVRTERKATTMAVNYICEQIQDKKASVYVIHSDNLEKAEMIRSEIYAKCFNVDVHINYISAVIAAHTGLDCIAIQYIVE